MSTIWRVENLERAWTRQHRRWLTTMVVGLVVMAVILTMMVVAARHRFAVTRAEPIPVQVPPGPGGEPVYHGNGMTLQVERFEVTTELPGEASMAGEPPDPPVHRPPAGSVFVVVHIREVVTDHQSLGDCTLYLGDGERRWEQSLSYGHWLEDVSSPLLPDEERCFSPWTEEPTPKGATRIFGKVLLVPESAADRVRPVVEVTPPLVEGQPFVERPTLAWL